MVMARGLGAVVIVGGVIAASAGCLLTSDFDGIAGTRSDAAAPSVDSGIEADAPEASAAFPCNPGEHLLCNNFDTGPIDNSGWVVGLTGLGSKAVLDTTFFHSPPAGFRSTIGALVKGMNAGGILRQTPAIGTFKTLIYAFDMRVLSCASLGNGGSVTLAAMQPSGAVAFGVVLIDTNVYSFAQLDLTQGTFTPEPFTVAPKADTWQRVEIRLSLNASAAHAVVMLDANKVVDVDEVPGTPSPSILLNIGANATGPISGCDVVYDNVTFDRQ